MATPFIDTFDGAGATTDLSSWTPTGGAAWTRQDGVASGVTVRTSGGVHPGSSTATSYICDDQGSSSQYVILRAPTTASAGIDAAYVAGRLVDASNCIGVVFAATGSTGTRLRKIVGGTITSLIEQQFVASEWLKVEIDGASGAAKVRLYSGGTGSSPGSWTLQGSEQTVSDSVFDGETSIGVRNADASSSSSFCVSFEAGALGGGGVTLAVTQGTYAITGQSVGLNAGRRLSATQGAYSLSGQSVTLRAARKLIATQGSYSLSGQSVTLTKASAAGLVATQGAYSLSGQSVTLRASRKLIATQGSYSLSGQSVTLTKSAAGGLLVTQGGYSLNGQPVTMRAARKLVVTQGAYALSGQPVGLFAAAAPLVVTRGLYALAGQSVQLQSPIVLRVTSGLYTLAGYAVGLAYVPPTPPDEWTPVGAASGIWTPADAAAGAWTPQ